MSGAARPRRTRGTKIDADAETPIASESAATKIKREAPPILSGADFAKQQIARLEGMLAGLLERANAGEPTVVDRILKILDRLDRYNGFTAAAAPVESEEDARERILQKLSDIDARRAAAKADA
ncbi:MAG TPA: hypothetical protein VKS78_02200 [Roseiarcus sp.]|nr:hypothetical protein [Roseiarcus sp.]